MNTVQLRRVLRRDNFTKNYFLDVFPSDHLPDEIHKYPSCFIVNVDSSAEPGSHWVAFYLSRPNQVEFFDSYGNDPTFYKGPISEFTSTYKNVKYNPMVLQSNVTAVCGQYCVYYLYCRCRGKSLKNIVSSFVTKHLCNDERVYNFARRLFHVRTSFYQ